MGLLFLRELLARAWESSVNSMSTSTLAIIGTFVYPLGDIIADWRQSGWRSAVMRHWKDRLKWGGVVALAWWAMLFGYHLVYKVPRDINTQANKILPPPYWHVKPLPPLLTEKSIEYYVPRNGLPKQQSKIEIVDIQGLSLINKGNGRSGFGLNVYYENKGAIACTIMSHRTFGFSLDADKELDVVGIDKFMNVGRQVRSPDPTSRFEIQPGPLPRHFFSYPDSDAGPEQMKELESNVLAGKKRFYLFVVMKYRDDALPKHRIRVSEFCGWFRDTFEMWHNCGNRIYTSKDE